MSFMFGKDKTQTKIPEWMERGGEEAFIRARDIAQMGYVPYMGPEVAAYNPTERAAAGMANAGAAAFGFDVPQGDPMAGLPMHSSGLGYSSYPIYQQAMDQLRTERPGQYDYMMSFMIDPVTGQPGSRAFSQPITQPGMDPMAGMFTEGPDSRNPRHTYDGPVRVSGPEVSSRRPAARGEPTRGGLLGGVQDAVDGIRGAARGVADRVGGGLLGSWDRDDEDGGKSTSRRKK